MAENRRKHRACCSHAIIADTVGITLKRQLDIAMTKQGLHSFWIGFDADEERCKTVAQIMEAESPWVIVYQSASVI